MIVNANAIYQFVSQTIDILADKITSSKSTKAFLHSKPFKRKILHAKSTLPINTYK